MEIASQPVEVLHGPSRGQRFPHGLRVLLCGEESSADACALQALNYHVTHAHAALQAAELLQDSSGSRFDVILADVSLLGTHLDSPDAPALFEAAADSGTPLVLMCQQYCTSDVMAAVQAGAADILERPLSPSKLRHLWQHTVRASLASSKSAATKHSCQGSHQPRQQQQQQHQQHRHHQQQLQEHKQHLHVVAPAAAAAGQPASPMCFGLLDDNLLDGLGGLELPPLVPSQHELDPDSLLFSDLQATEPSTAPLFDSLDQLLPPGSPSYSNAATAVAGSMFGCSSEQQCSGNTNFTVTELESCAEASSAASPQHRRKLRACTSMRRMAAAASAAAGGDQCQAGSSGPSGQPAVGRPLLQSGVPPMAMGPCMPGGPGTWQWGSASCWAGSHWGGMGMGMPPAPGPLGCVWGMPMHNVAVAPGIVPPQGAAAAAAAQAGTPASSSFMGASCTGSGSTLSAQNTGLNTAGIQFGGMQGAAAAAPPAYPPPPPPGMWAGMWPGMWQGMCFPVNPANPGMMYAQHPGSACALMGPPTQVVMGPTAPPQMHAVS